LPATHCWNAPLQTLPQIPQFSSSAWVSTHSPLHWEKPLLQVMTQLPPVQPRVPLGSLGQALLQPLQ
jgi:hypothetical protein